MTEPNAKDPLEELFARQPLERVPESVYERLQSRAAWNRPSPWSRTLLFASLALLAAILCRLFLVFPQTGRLSDHPEQTAPIVSPAASAPVIALTLPVGAERSDDDVIRDIGGLSTRFTPKEPPADPNPNAAVGYLLAIGWMNPAPDKVLREIAETETVAALGKMSPETRRYLGDSKVGTVVRFLIQGAAQDLCEFHYGHTWRSDEPVAPFKRLRELARLARAYGLDQIASGKESEALAIFRAIFRLGSHLETDGTLLAGMVGLAFKEISVQGFAELIKTSKDGKTAEEVRQFIRAQPKATFSAARCLEGEKKYLTGSCQMIKDGVAKGDDLRQSWSELKWLLPQEMIPTNLATPTAPPVPPLKACQANQRVLAGAVELLAMDFNPMPASLTVANIPGFLASAHYIKEFPICPEGGKYELSKLQDGEYQWRCTVHPQPGTATEEKIPDLSAADPGPLPAELEAIRDFFTGPRFGKMTTEALATLDEAMTLDPYAPGYDVKIEAFQNKVARSPNPLIRQAIPNIKKVFGKQKQLDESIQQLLGN